MKFKIATSLFAAVLALASVGCGESDPKAALYTGETSQLDEVALVGIQARSKLKTLDNYKAYQVTGDLQKVLVSGLKYDKELSEKYIENFTEGVYSGSWDSFREVNRKARLDSYIDLNKEANESGQYDVFLRDIWIYLILNDNLDLPELGDKTAYDKWKEKNCYASRGQFTL